MPVARMNPEDVPNIAIIFNERVKMPGSPWGILPPFVYRGRRAKGLMIRSADPARVASLFAPWGVVRDVTSDDVLAQDLRVGKPLRGWRTWVYAVLVLIPLILRVASRVAHHG